MRKFLAAFLCLGMLLTSVPVQAEAKEADSAEQTGKAEETAVVTYEKPGGYTLPTGVTDDSAGKYTVTVNDEPLDLYPAQVGLQADTEKSAKSAFGYFDLSEPVTVKVTAGFDFDSVVVRPLSLGIEPEVDERGLGHGSLLKDIVFILSYILRNGKMTMMRQRYCQTTLWSVVV